jgi:hypothetical protein
VTLRAQVIGADEMLAAALDPFTGRASRIAATQASTSSGIDFAANAQAAADVGLVDDADLELDLPSAIADLGDGTGFLNRGMSC